MTGTPIWETIAKRSIHEQNIAKIFASSSMRPSAEDTPSQRPVLILVFTNRSGSNYFCDCLAATGKYEQAGEALNWDIVRNRAHRENIASFPRYCAHAIANQGDQDKHVVLKASIAQLIMLWKHNILGDTGLLRNVKYAYIERRDVVGQAVSHSIADQTRQFTSKHRGKGEEATFDCADIQKRLNNIVQQNALTREFFSTVNLSVFPMLYEAFINDPNLILDRFGKFVGVEGLAIDHDKTTLRRQATSKNTMFKTRFKNEMTLALTEWSKRGSVVDKDDSGGA